MQLTAEGMKGDLVVMIAKDGSTTMVDAAWVVVAVIAVVPLLLLLLLTKGKRTGPDMSDGHFKLFIEVNSTSTE